MADLNFSLQKLNDFNYEIWKFRIDLLLIKEGLKDVVENPTPTTPDAVWIANDG